MRKIITLVIMLLLSLSLVSCGDGNDKLSQEEAGNKIEKISRQVQNGEITEQEAMKMMEEISKNTKSGLDILKEEQDNVSDFDGIPGWAKDLGAVEPEGLTLDPKQSSITEEDAKKHMNEDFSAHYYGDADKLISEAKRLTKAVNGKITDEQSDYILASGELGGKHSLSISVRTDVDKPFMHYSIVGTKKFDD